MQRVNGAARALILWGLIFGAAAAQAAAETIVPFRLRSCVSAGSCVEIEAARATRGYLSNTYYMEGPIVLRADGQTQKMDSGYYDPASLFVLVRTDADFREVGIDLKAGRVLRFGPGPLAKR